MCLLQYGPGPWMHETDKGKYYPPGPLCGSEQQTCAVTKAEANDDVVVARNQSVCVHLRSTDDSFTGEAYMHT